MAIISKARSKKNRRRGTFSYKSNAYQGKSQRKIIKRVILLIALSVAFFFLFSLLNQSVTKIQYVKEMKRVSPDELRGISTKIYDEGFLQINLSDIKEEIGQVNWVKSVSLERQWPDQINILIEEEDIIGWWNKDSIINSKGNLFSLITGAAEVSSLLLSSCSSNIFCKLSGSVSLLRIKVWKA